MKQERRMPMNSLRRQLAAKLSIGITLLTTPIFVVALGILFLYSHHLLYQDTATHANNILQITSQHLRSELGLVENAVNSNAWLMEENFRPDSLQSICHRLLRLNRTPVTCQVVTDSVEMSNIKLGFSVGTTANGDTLFYYSRALHPDGDAIKGIVTAGLPIKRLKTIIKQAEQPFPVCEFLLLENDQTFDTEDAHVFYDELPDTDWTLALICPDSEFEKSYRQLAHIAYFLFIGGLLLILIICYLLTRHTIKPLHKLLAYTKNIVSGQYAEVIPRSNRKDAIGRLQNSVVVMQQSLLEHVDSIRKTGEETQKHNEELARAQMLAEEGVQKKAIFIQNVSHQMRTPLNIIMGFADVLGESLAAQQDSASQSLLQDAELADITETMTHNAIHLRRMVQMLYDSSEYGTSQELFSGKSEYVTINNIAQECIEYTRERFPKTTINFESNIPPRAVVKTNHLYLMRTLRELLFNAAKYSDGQHIMLRISETISTIRFTVEDVGPGILSDTLGMIFKPFVKVDDLSEGLGLGLPLAKRHALSLGGDLIYDVDYHDGCRFILEVPK
jgi:signal transduction histidine kinase